MTTTATSHRRRSAKLVEERSDEEFNQLLASLPKQKGLAFNLYQFEGFWYSAHHLQAILHCRTHFRALDSDVLLVTGPKTGSTWLKSLVFSLFNRGSAESMEKHPLITKNPHELIPFLEINTYADPKRVPDLSGLPSPRLFSTHIPACSLPPTTLLGSGCRIVYLCRDPRDVLISLWNFSNKLIDPAVDGELPLEEVFDAFCNGTSDNGPFWDHILGYWKHSLEMPSRVMFLTYEEMKADTASSLTRLAAFLGCPFSEGDVDQVQRIIQLCSFDHLRRLEVNKTGKLPHGLDNNIFFRRGQVGDWLNYLTPEMTLRLDTIIKDKLRASGFNYY